MPAKLRIVKIGGSLFDLPDLANRLRSFLREEPSACNILIAGGGLFVDQVRKWHGIHPLDDEVAHWACIEQMLTTARLLADSLGMQNVITDISALPTHEVPATAIFDVANWLRAVEPTTDGTKLPIGWHVTSDSIAARLATVLDADELVLLKSALPNSDTDIGQLASSGYVDAAFPTIAEALPAIRFVNLRTSNRLLVRRTQYQA